MLFFVLSLITSIGILSSFKIFTHFQIDNIKAIVVNYIVCVVLSLIFSKPFTQEIIFDSWIYWTIPLGITFFYGFKFFALSSQKAGIAVTSVAGNISVVIPVTIAFIFYGEVINTQKIIGILLAIVSFYFIFKAEKEEIKLQKVWLYPLLIFLLNGANNSMTKHAEHLGAKFSIYIFLGMVFGIALLFATIHLIKDKKGNIFQKENLIAGLILGLLNFFSSFFFLNAVSKFESSYFFPAYNLSYILLAAITGFLVFKEKLRLINWFGILMAIFAILILTGLIWKV